MKYILSILALCCFYLSAQAVSPEVPELKKSDANIMGHVLDKATKEHLPSCFRHWDTLKVFG
nr:hypothetical protein [uncultured Bacteroides sp.]